MTADGLTGDCEAVGKRLAAMEAQAVERKKAVEDSRGAKVAMLVKDSKIDVVASGVRRCRDGQICE